jgi:hypothetical protein
LEVWLKRYSAYPQYNNKLKNEDKKKKKKRYSACFARADPSSNPSTTKRKKRKDLSGTCVAVRERKERPLKLLSVSQD